MPSQKNMNKKQSQPKRVRYRTLEKWKTNAIKKLKKHLKKYDKNKNDKQSQEALKKYENKERRDKIRGRKRLSIETQRKELSKSEQKFKQKELKKKSKGLVK